MNEIKIKLFFFFSIIYVYSAILIMYRRRISVSIYTTLSNTPMFQQKITPI
jgi:hypothetical protein